jgi:hypothetical protein
MNFWNGMTTVVTLELKQRIRSKLWIWAIVIWFVFIGAVTTLIMTAVAATGRNDSEVLGSTPYQTGPLAFGLIVLFVLGMGLVIAPTFTATSINSDRYQSVLATLQATRLSALQIAAGKLVAAWLTSLLFIVVALPFIIWSVTLGDISAGQVLVCFATIFIEVAVVCAIGLGWSALISRPVGSAVLTYLSVVALCVLSMVVMSISLALAIEEDAEVQVWRLSTADQTKFDQQYEDGDLSWAAKEEWARKCTWNTETEFQIHTERVWWMLLPNPFVIVADAAPLPPSATNLERYISSNPDPLAMIKLGVRSMARPPATERDDCVYIMLTGYDTDYGYDDDGNVWVTQNGLPMSYTSPVKQPPLNIETPIWPWGLGINLALGAGFFIIAWLRLRVPYARLPKGQRVA